MSEQSVEEEILCRCDDPMWLIQLFIDGALKDELLVDTAIDNANTIAEQARDRHWDLAMEAMKDGHQWRVKLCCPNCGAGILADSTYGPLRMEPDTQPQMLHILGRAERADLAGGRGPIIAATCGCQCVASPPTHEKLKDADFKHVTYCLPCWEKEHD